MRWLRMAWDWFLDVPLLRVLALLWPLAGVLLVGYGAWQVYKPAGFIAVGLLIIFDSLHASFLGRAQK